MKLWTRLAIGVGVAGALWLLLQARATRADRESEHAPPVPAIAEPAASPELVAVPALAPGTEGREPGESARTPVPAAPVPSEAPPSPARSSGPSRGRLVDERTSEPIPDALVATRTASAHTDAQGRFDTGEPLGELDELQVLNVARNGSVKEVPRERWTRHSDGWEVPLVIGPTYRLRLTGPEQASSVPWEGRLLQGDDDGGRWLTLIDGPLPYLRYDEPIPARGRGARLWVEVRSKDGLLDGRGEADSLVGVQEVEVACRARAVLRGRVVDEEGAACGGIEIEALQLAPDSTQHLRAATGKDGGYQLGAAAAGTMIVVALATRGTRLPELRLPVPSGVTRAPDIVLARPAGSIRGTVRCRSGAGWIDASVRLRALDGSGFEQETGVGLGSESALRKRYERLGIDLENVGLGVPAQRTSGEFVLVDLPPGRFELSISTPQGYPCSPAALEVAAPAKGIVFTIDDEVRVRSYRLRAVDAESRAALERLHWLVRVGGAGAEPEIHPSSDGSVLELADGVGFEWWASAPGYRLARGTERDFERQDEEYAATCALRPGFGARLALQDWTGSLTRFSRTRDEATTRWDPVVLPGVEVVADGVRVATSDERGIAVLDLPAAPLRIDVRLAGWRAVDSHWFRDGRVLGFPEARCGMVRE